MSFKVQFVGGPWAGVSQERRSAPDYVHVRTDETVGIYSLDKLTATIARMVWRESKDEKAPSCISP